MEGEKEGILSEERPWGGFLVLEERSTHKVKRIWVHPGHRLSYQKHRFRSEHWVVVEGEAKVVLDGKEVLLRPGDSVDIPVGAAHRIENTGGRILTFIEIQRGENFSEEDVIRLEDDYGRVHP